MPRTAGIAGFSTETGGGTSFPTQMAIAATARDSDAYDVARAIAEEGRAVGIQLNFAPVVDVNVNPNNPVIGTRSFGEDPALVQQMETIINGLQGNGNLSANTSVLATAKHFLGDGGTKYGS